MSDEEEGHSPKKVKRYLQLPTFAEAGEVYSLLKDANSIAGTDFLIVDVRDLKEREESGYIIGSVNIPAHLLETPQLTQIAEQFKEVKTLIFHCALSQVRGPKSAQNFVRYLNNTSEIHRAEQSVLILRGGFEHWKTSDYAEDKDHTVRFFGY